MTGCWQPSFPALCRYNPSPSCLQIKPYTGHSWWKGGFSPDRARIGMTPWWLLCGSAAPVHSTRAERSACPCLQLAALPRRAEAWEELGMSPPEGLEEGRVRKQRMVGFEPTQRRGHYLRGLHGLDQRLQPTLSRTAPNSCSCSITGLKGPTPFDSHLWELLLVICLTVNF